MNNTIFDDVFRTMVEKMPRLVIPLLNEVFGTTYPEDTEIIQLRNEHQDGTGELAENELLPSVRALSGTLKISALT